MASDRVKRVQELRRSNAAVPRPGRRPTGPSAEEWVEEQPRFVGADGQVYEFELFDSDGVGVRRVEDGLAPADRHLARELAKPPWRCVQCFLSECTCTDCDCAYCGTLPELTDVLTEAIARQTRDA